MDQASGKTGLSAIPKGIWALGFVSLFMDVSSEMIHALLPVYMVTALGASALSVGIIEGIAEATAAIVKVGSGTLSDWVGRRKPLIVLGYGLAALTKPVFPLASSLSALVAARFIDRIGKGIRGAPRDALVADLAPPDIRARSFGLRQSMDTIGAFIGPIIALFLMWLSENNFPLVFWIAVLPAFLSLLIALLAVPEPATQAEKAGKPRPLPLRRTDLSKLPAAFWGMVAIATLFTLARFSEAFLLLDATCLAVPAGLVPLVLIGMNVIYATSSYPVGIAADRIGKAGLLQAGIALLIAADLALSLIPGLAGLAIGTALWGLHMGFTQGLFATLVADTAPADLRGTAFGFYNLMTGIGLLCASSLAGLLWSAFGPQTMFLTGACLAGVSALCLTLWLRKGSL